jgi:hypothetical protein
MTDTFVCWDCKGEGWRRWRPGDPVWSEGGETFDVCLSRLCETCSGTGIVVTRTRAGLATSEQPETQKAADAAPKDSAG